MYKEVFSLIGEILDMAKIGDKWGMLDRKQDALMAAGDNRFIRDTIEAAHETANKMMVNNGSLSKWWAKD